MTVIANPKVTMGSAVGLFQSEISLGVTIFVINPISFETKIIFVILEKCVMLKSNLTKGNSYGIFNNYLTTATKKQPTSSISFC